MTERQSSHGDRPADRLIGWEVSTTAPDLADRGPSEAEALRAELLRARSELRLGISEHFDDARMRLGRQLGRTAPGLSTEAQETREAMLVRAAALTTLARLEARLGDPKPGLFEEALQLFTRSREDRAVADGPFETDEVIALAHTGRLDDAERRLSEFALRPENADLLVELSHAYHADGRLAEARAALERAAALDPEDDAIVVELGGLLAASGDRSAAVDAYGVAAVARAQAGRYEAAERLIDQALAVDPDTSEAIRVKGELLRLTGRDEEALAWLEEGLARRPGSTRLSTARARTLLGLGRVTEALDALKEAREPTADTELVRTEALVVAGRLAEALEAAEAAVDLDPDSGLGYAARADVQRRLGRNEEALASLNSALSLDPMLWEALIAKASVLLALDQAHEAVEPAGRAVALVPDNVGALVEFGESLRKTQQYERAREPLERAVALAPNDAWACGTLGQVLAALGEPDAVPTLEKSLEIDPTLAWARDTLATWLTLRRNPARALELVDQGLRLDPPPMAKAGLLVDRGEALRVLGRYEEALRPLEEALELVPDEVWALGALGQVLVALGRAPDAINPLRRALELSDSAVWALEALVDALVAADQVGAVFALLWDQQNRGLPRETVVELGSRVTATVAVDGEDLAAILAEHPEWLAGQFLRADTFARSNDYTFALEGIEHVVANDPTWTAARVAQIEVLRALDRAAEAESVVDDVLVERPNDAAMLRAKHALVFERSGAAEAEAFLRSLVERDPQQAWAQLELGRALRERGRDEEAVDVLRRALDADGDPDIAETLSEALSAVGRPEDAVEVVMDAIRRYPGSAALHADLGYTLYVLDRGEEALLELDRSLALDFAVGWVLTTRGAVLTDLRRDIEALDSFDLALSLDGDDVQALARKASVLNDLGEFEEAIPLFARSIEVEQPPWVLNRRAWAELNVGGNALALNAYHEAVAADPDDLWSHKGIGDVLARRGADSEAEANDKFAWVLGELEKRDALEPGHALYLEPVDALGLRGWCAYQRREYDTALAALTDALAIDALDAALQFDLALVTLSSGDPRRGIVEYQRGLDITEQHEGLRGGSILRVALIDLREAVGRHAGVAEADDREAITSALDEAQSAIRSRTAEARGRSAHPGRTKVRA